MIQTAIAPLSPAAKPAVLNDHPLFLGNLALALSRTAEDARKVLDEEERYFSAYENGERVTSIEVASKKKELDSKQAAVNCLEQMIEDAKVGNFYLPVGGAVACLEPAEGQLPSIVFILPNELPRMVQKNNGTWMSEGAQLFFFDRRGETASLLADTPLGQVIHVPWSDKDFVMKEFIPASQASSN